MRKFFTLVFCIAISSFAFSQMPGGPGGGRPGGAGGGNMNMGRFYGKVVDSKTNKPIEAVSIQLITAKFDTVTKKRRDTVISGMLTTKGGNFSLENLPLFGQFRLKITAIGYKEIEQKVAFEMKMGGGGDMSQALNAIDKDLGNIKLEQDAKVLEAVTVTGSKPLVSTGIDRKIFNVEKNITSTGGTAVDVMRNVPSVQVDIDGNVQLRNAAPQIYVDGRPTTLTLEQIPADAIASVEVITNPSAKYDASGGTAGILNIVLKKNRKAGYNGNVRLGVDMRGKFNVGGDINVRQGKVNVFASAMLNQRKSISNGETDRLTTIGYPNTKLHQIDNSTMEGFFGFGRAGMDYFIDNRNTISVSGTFVRGKFEPFSTTDMFLDTLYTGYTGSSFSQRFSNSEGEFKNRGGMLSYKHNFTKAGQEWTADINYNKSNNINNNTINTFDYYSQGGPLKNEFRQLQEGAGITEFFTFQTDYVNPIKDKAKVEMGARAQFRNVESLNDVSFYGSTGEYIKVPQLSSEFKNKDRVYAAYATFTNAHKNFGYQIGFRFESSTYDGEVNTTDVNGKDSLIHYGNSFPISLFPSVFLSQKLKHDQELQFNFSRRVNRPSFFQLFPFVDYSDSLNLNRGNPNLRPEFTYSTELSYTKTYKGNNTFMVSGYFKYTDDLITRYQVKAKHPVSGRDVVVNTWINANSSYVTGMEFINRHAVAKWWDLTTNLNLFTSKINMADTLGPTQDPIFSYFFKINNSFKLPKNFTIQLSGDYQSKTILPPGGSSGQGGGGRPGGGGGFGGPSSAAQGYTGANYGVDMAVRFDFLKEKRASLTVSMNDILRTRKYVSHTESPYFVQDSWRRRDPQFVRVNFSWRFGKFDMSLFKRKNLRGESEGMQQGMQGVQQ